MFVVKAEVDITTFLKDSSADETTEEGIPLIEIEGMFDTTELRATRKNEDYKYPRSIVRPGNHLTTREMAFSSGDLRLSADKRRQCLCFFTLGAP
jgi:hypothetical protein